MLEKRTNFTGVVLDVDGVIWIAGAPAVGAQNFLRTLRKNKMPFCFLTNGCNSSKAERHRALVEAGLPIRIDQLVNPADITKKWLRDASVESIIYLGAPTALVDLAKGLRVNESGPVDAVIVGDLFSYYDRRLLESAAKAVRDGAALVAMQRNATWCDGENWYVDNGFWVAGFEYVTGRKAIVMGKPNRTAYLTAVARLRSGGKGPSRIAFVSDDIATDPRGAKAAGLTTVYCGRARRLPRWVDCSAHDITGLTSLFIGDC